MKISAQGGGGFSGRAEQYEVDTSELANGPALEALLQDLDFFAAAPVRAAGADIPAWRITVADGARAHTVAFSEDGSPGSAPWQALLVELRSVA